MADKVKNIYQRLNAVMAEVSYIQKDEKKVNNQYRFVSHDSVSASLHGPMTKHGIVCVPTIREVKQDGNRTEVILDVFFVNVDDPSDKVHVTYWGYGIDQADKGIGKAVSYAFKYALLKVFCLETGDDPDQDQNVRHEPKTEEKKEQAVQTVPASQIKAFFKSFGKHEDMARAYAEHISSVYEWDMNTTMLKFMKDPEKTRNALNKWISDNTQNVQQEIA